MGKVSALERILKRQLKHASVLIVGCILMACREEQPTVPALGAADILIRNASPELVFQGELAGKHIHLIVQDRAVYEISGEAGNKTISKVLEPEFYPLSFCQREFLKAEKGAVVVWLGKMAFGAGGCCATGGTYETTDGRAWKKASNNTIP